MWIKKTVKDQESGAVTPIPTQIVSNEEFPPLPQTHDQKAVESKVEELADTFARKLGTTRREFLKTTGGMATGFLALNAVHGCSFIASEEEALDGDAYSALLRRNEFIFDAQVHHVKDSIEGPMVFRTLTERAGLNPDLSGINPGPDTLHRANFVKEVFFDSDTVMALMTGAVIGPKDHHALPSPDMVETRNRVNAAAGTQRMLSHGLADPMDPAFLAEEIYYQVNDLKVDGFKCYPGNPTGAWKIDDPEVAFPFYEKALELGVRNISFHIGLPLPGKWEDYYRPDGIIPAAKAFPDINFIIYHASMKHMMTMLPPGESGIGDDGYLPWVTDMVKAQKQNPDVTNVYPELGAVFGHSVVTHPDICGHLLGQLVECYGSEKIIWGTDSIWWGSPQWQIEAFRRFQMPEKLQEDFKYPTLSKRDKELIFGINVAGLYDVDVAARRTSIPADALSQMKTAYIENGPEPSHTQYGWVAV